MPPLSSFLNKLVRDYTLKDHTIYQVYSVSKRSVQLLNLATGVVTPYACVSKLLPSPFEANVIGELPRTGSLISLDGYLHSVDVCVALRGEPLVLQTSRADADKMTRCFELTIDEFVAKGGVSSGPPEPKEPRRWVPSPIRVHCIAHTG